MNHEGIEYKELCEKIDSLISLLYPLHRKVIEYRYFSNLSVEEIANKMKVCKSRVYVLLKESLKKMKIYLDIQRIPE
jgi:RNA polymerase sigma factor (sigma-70 family)